MFHRLAKRVNTYTQCLFQFFVIILIQRHFLLYIDKFLHHFVLDLKDEKTDTRTKNRLLLCHL